MAFPVAIVAAIISAIGSKYAADGTSKQAAMQSAGAGANKQPVTTLEMMPTFNAGEEQQEWEDAQLAKKRSYEGPPPPIETPGLGTPIAQTPPPPSAIGRTLEEYDKQSLIRPGSTDNSAAYIPPTGSVMPPSQPKQEGAQGGAGGMTSLEMAQLGLMLGSQLFKREKGPPPPGLPSSSFSPMRPVFRG